MILRDIIARNLRRKKTKSIPVEGYAWSAVLVPLVLVRGQYQLIFTQRTDQVKNHKNQISFPGGVREKKDRSLLETALRESEEEIGLSPKMVDVLGQLGEIFTPTRYRITPFVGLLHSPFSLNVNPREIKKVIRVPLKHLLEPKNMTVDPVEFFPKRFDIPYFRYKNHTIWGATGRITWELVQLLQKNGNPTSK